MVVLKISHMDKPEFVQWLDWCLLECTRNGAEGFDFNCYTGTEKMAADYYELWGNSGVLCYAKTKWG